MGMLHTTLLAPVLTIAMLTQQLPLLDMGQDMAPATDMTISAMVASPIPSEPLFELSDSYWEAVEAHDFSDNGPTIPETEWRDRLIYMDRQPTPRYPQIEP